MNFNLKPTKQFSTGLYLHGSLPLEDEGLFLQEICEKLLRPQLLENKVNRASLDNKIEDIINLINQERIEFLCGYSMGGRLLQSLVSSLTYSPKLIVLMGSALPLENQKDKEERIIIDQQRAIQITTNFPQFLMDWYSSKLWSLEENVRSELIHLILKQYSSQQSKDNLAQLITFFSPGIYPTTNSFTTLNLQKLKNTRFIYMTGELDTKYFREVSAFQTILPSSKHVIIKGTGHKIHHSKVHQEQIIRAISSLTTN